MKEITKDKSWVDEAVEWYAIPEEDREPKLIQDFFTKLNVPKSTFYWETSKPEFISRVIGRALNREKKRIANVLGRLGRNAEGGQEKSIEMYLKHVIGLAEKMNVTMEGKSDTEKALELLNKYVGHERDSKTVQDKRTGSKPVAGAGSSIRGDSGDKTQEGAGNLSDPIRKEPDSSTGSNNRSNDTERKV
jgi:hypothetical protein